MLTAVKNAWNGAVRFFVRANRQRIFRTILVVEELGARITPSTFTWNYTGGAVGLESNSANWLENGAATNNTPDATSDLVFAAGTGSCNLDSRPYVNSLTIQAGYNKVISSSIGAMGVQNGGSMAAGTISLANNQWFAINGGTFTWSGGTFSGTSANGNMVNVNAGTFSITGSAVRMGPTLFISSLDPTIPVYGTVTISGLGSDVTFSSGVEVNYGILNITQATSVNLLGTGQRISVDELGDFVYNTAATVNSQLTLINNGETEIKQGTFHITGQDANSGYSASNLSGQLAITAGATFSADFGTNNNGGELYAASVGTSNIIGSVYVHAGDISMYPNGSGQGSGNFYINSNFTMDGGTFYEHIWSQGGPNPCNTVTLGTGSTATLGGSADLNVTTQGGAPSNGTYYDIIIASTITGEFSSFEWYSVTYNHAIVSLGAGQAYRLSFNVNQKGP